MAIIRGTNGDDKFPNELEGSNLADQIFGLAGDDALIGFNGDDILIGGPGADDLFGSGGLDFASYQGSRDGVVVDLQAAVGRFGDAEGDGLFGIDGVIGSARGDYLVGDPARNILRGEQGSDELSGNQGNDLLAGGAGNDLLFGGAGADELRGDAGVDYAGYGDSQQGVNIDLATGRGRGGTAEGDRLVSVETIQGSDLGDRITGNAAANQFAGDRGADVLAGGAGADRFFYLAPTDSTVAAPDRILDFSRSQGDKIVVGAIDAVLEEPGEQRFEFIGSDQFTDPGQIRSFQQNGDTIIEGNTTDLVAGPEFKLVLDPLLNLQASDFIFADIGFGPRA